MNLRSSAHEHDKVGNGTVVYKNTVWIMIRRENFWKTWRESNSAEPNRDGAQGFKMFSMVTFIL